MPMFMKKDAISILEGGIETYLLALYGLNLPTTRIRKVAESKYAPIMGLLGASVELLIKACLVQAKGINAMYKDNDINTGIFKMGSAVIDEFKSGIKDLNPEFNFIWKNQNDASEQQKIFLAYSNKFKMLQVTRANGLHAGIGCSRDIVVVTINDVYDFIKQLSFSKKLGAYLRNIPAPEATVRDREVILEDLSRRLSSTNNLNSKVEYLRNMYLVLPYVPDVTPDWIDTFDKIQITPPTANDVNYLVRSLSDAHSIYLLKNRGGKDGIPVKPDPNNPKAIPIAVQYIKRELTSVPDKFRNDILTANTRYKEKRLDLPIEDFIIDIFALGIEEAGILPLEKKFTAQDTWPFVASAIQTQGAPRPYWFMIRYCDEIDRLKDFLIKSSNLGNGFFKKRVNEVIEALNYMKENKTINNWKSKSTYEELTNYYKNCIKYQNEIRAMFTPAYFKRYPVSENVAVAISRYLSNEISAGETLACILNLGVLTENDKRVSRMLLKVSYKYSDRGGLIAVLRTEHLKGYISPARKMMYYTDFIKNGPIIKDISKENF